MGYTTDFEGVFEVSPAMSDDLYNRLYDLQNTRNCAGSLETGGYNTVDRSGGKPDSLWCDWTPTADRCGIEWNGTENFYEYVEWLQYIINAHLVPNGHTLSGVVRFRGEDENDVGVLTVENDVVHKEVWGAK